MGSMKVADAHPSAVALEPAIGKQQRNVSELTSSEQGNLSDVQGRLEKLLEGLSEVTSGLAATNGQLAENLESSRPEGVKGLTTSAVTSSRVATDNRRKASVAIRPACKPASLQARCIQISRQGQQKQFRAHPRCGSLSRLQVWESFQNAGNDK